ncbi:Rad60/SUMO-like domain [Dillenia turbinata]|uniref:Rad60/SUMO-like domain n=1 Tax=Dillenia turbinata TaxID=194707 RepID=A0AAN8Z0A0_9MAGN
MDEPAEELEPLFDYSRVQPLNYVCLDDDSSDSPSNNNSSKLRKSSESYTVKEEKNGKLICVIDCEEADEGKKEEDDWLPPPPKVARVASNLGEDSTIKELRLKKQELASFACSAEDVLRAVEESARRQLGGSLQDESEAVPVQSTEPTCEKAKIVISIQAKDEVKQFRVYKDDKFERLFKMYADKAKLDLKNLVFMFDGDKVCPTATPSGLDMEDDDIIEVHVKKS